VASLAIRSEWFGWPDPNAPEPEQRDTGKAADETPGEVTDTDDDPTLVSTTPTIAAT